MNSVYRDFSTDEIRKAVNTTLDLAPNISLTLAQWLSLIIDGLRPDLRQTTVCVVCGERIESITDHLCEGL